MKHASSLAVAASTLALIVAGCGSSATTSSKSTTATPTSAAATTSATPSAGYGSGSASPSAVTASAITIASKQDKLGTILDAGPRQMTVYMFEGDKGSQSACAGACTHVWPPVTTTGAASSGGAAVAANLGTITRSDGTKQVTYKGHPLYFFARDGDKGDAYGQGVNGFGASWYVIAPSGAKVDKS